MSISLDPKTDLLRLVVVVVATLAAGAAAAAEKAPVCVPRSARATIFAVRGAPVLCWDDRGDCLALGATAGSDRVVPHPPARSPEAVVSEHGTQVCAGTTCKRLGKLLAGAIAHASAEAKDSPLTLRVARDLSVVAIFDQAQGAGSAWNVANDRELRLRPPADSHGPNAATLAVLDIVGSTLVATWVCGAQCARSVLVDATGANLGASLPASVGIELDDHRLVLAGHEDDAVLVVLDPKSGKQLGRLVFASYQAGDTSLERLGPNEIALAWNPLLGGSEEQYAARVTVGKTPALEAVRAFVPCVEPAESSPAPR